MGLLRALQFHMLLHCVPEVQEGPTTSTCHNGLEHHPLRMAGDEDEPSTAPREIVHIADINFCPSALAHQQDGLLLTLIAILKLPL